jgi:uncharacterized membrane protein YfcA
VATLPGAIAGAAVVGLLSRGVFDVLFGSVLTLLSVALLVNPDRRLNLDRIFPAGEHREFADADGKTYRYAFNLPLGMAVSVAVGFASSLLGIGGGIIHVPFMAQILGFPVHVAIATSHAVLAVMAGAGTITHYVLGAFNGTGWRTPFLAAGIVAGAQVGARLSDRVKSMWLLRLLALA